MGFLFTVLFLLLKSFSLFVAMFVTCAEVVYMCKKVYGEKHQVNTEHNGVGIKMVGWMKELVCTAYWVCVAASTEAGDGILMLCKALKWKWT
jgi:hypothetical protein